MPPTNPVEGSQKLEQIFGDWPSFHDAEVLDITLDRDAHGADRGPTVRLTVHVFQATSEVDSRGYYVSRNHVLVRIALYSAEVLHLDGFNGQNALSALRFSTPAEAIAPDLAVQVDLGPCYGFSASFQCARVEIVSVEPFGRPDR